MTSKIGMLFLASRSGVPHPRHATYEPSDHTYRHMRQYKREMTVLEVMEIYKKINASKLLYTVLVLMVGECARNVTRLQVESP